VTLPSGLNCAVRSGRWRRGSAFNEWLNAYVGALRLAPDDVS